MDLWARFTALIVVRRSDTVLPALLAPEEVLLLRMNLQLQLESARLALLHNDQDNFVSALRAARAWLREYFDQTAPEVIAAMAQLQQLESTDIMLRLPDISAPLQALRQVRSQLDLQAAKPPGRRAAPSVEPAPGAAPWRD
jgi:uroporphyrin-3 C-methyltransferase